MMRLGSLKQKEVISITQGKTLGYIADLEIEEGGRICALIVPEGCGLKGLLKNREYVIPWRNICKIGSDCILVEIDAGALRTRR